MNYNNPTIKSKLENLPTNPGVYLFKNKNGKVVYIGKAKNLRNRVRTYFRKSGRIDHKTKRLMSQAVDFDLLVTENEIESLILEANLVREHKPRYNVMLKDDKHFPYIKITADPFPRMLIVRRLEKDNASYFGPYTSAKKMRQTHDLLCRLFKVRSCNLEIPAPKGKTHQVCLDYHIHRCKGPCVGLQSKEDYSENIDAIKMILSGRTKKLLGILTDKMNNAAIDEDYESAKDSRDQIEAIKGIMSPQNVDIGEVVDRDIIAIERDAGDAVAVVMQIREGVLLGRQDFQLSADISDSEETILDTFLGQYYNHQPNLPDEIFVTHNLPHHRLLEQWLKELKGSKIKLFTPLKGNKVRLVDLAIANARLLLDELLIRKKSQANRTSKMVSTLQKELNIPITPRTIVCFDISNTGETDTVGSCVYFENARPKKSEYRHFKIKGVSGQDDFSMMREVVGRYFYRRTNEKKELPSLVVIDGGKGQLSSVVAELKSLDITDQFVISLAKRLEEVYLPGQSEPITISKSSPALMLLKQIRDEAHRFAITYNRTVRTKRTFTSELDKIKGVGPAKRTALMKHFGSVKAIKESQLEEIEEVSGITSELAKKIKTHLNKSELLK